jgi:hypothetical protein
MDKAAIVKCLPSMHPVSPTNKIQLISLKISSNFKNIPPNLSHSLQSINHPSNHSHRATLLPKVTPLTFPWHIMWEQPSLVVLINSQLHQMSRKISISVTLLPNINQIFLNHSLPLPLQVISLKRLINNSKIPAIYIHRDGH